MLPRHLVMTTMLDKQKITKIIGHKIGANTKNIEILHTGYNTCGINHKKMIDAKHLLNENPKAICSIFMHTESPNTNVGCAIIDTKLEHVLYSTFLDSKDDKQNKSNKDPSSNLLK